MQLTDRLMMLGLSRHEAEIYVLMHREGAMTGYEAAKLSGISRSNAYPALSGLVEKGAAHKIAGDVQKYIAVPAADFCRNKKRQYNDIIDWIEYNMPQQKYTAEPFITVSGEQNIIDQIKNLISQAELRIYAAMDSEMIHRILAELKNARQRDLKVVLITDAFVSLAGATIYHMKRKPGQIRLIVDSEQVMTGEIGTSSEPACLFSKNQTLVTLFKEAMMNEIELIRLGSEQVSKTDN